LQAQAGSSLKKAAQDAWRFARRTGRAHELSKRKVQQRHCRAAEAGDVAVGVMETARSLRPELDDHLHRAGVVRVEAEVRDDAR
jgi:hypothetical protein